jgi:hypothetical protein
MSDDLEQLLRDGLRHRAAQVRLRPGLAMKAHRRRQRRRVAARSATAAGLAAAVAAVSVSAAGVTGSGGASRSGAGTQHGQTAAYVISHAEAALSATAAENPVVYVHVTGNSGIAMGGSIRNSLDSQQQDQWYHGSQQRSKGFTTAGQAVYDTGEIQTPVSATSVVVDYPARIWWRVVQHAPPGAKPWPTTRPPRSCADVSYFAINFAPTEWAPDIHKALACGQFTSAGTEQFDGVNAIKLIPVRPDVMAAILWIDPSTYLPVRVDIEMRTRPGGGFELVNRQDVRWLAPTAANRAHLAVPIPAGFIQVPPPPSGTVSARCLSPAHRAAKCVTVNRRALNAWYAKYVTSRG